MSKCKNSMALLDVLKTETVGQDLLLDTAIQALKEKTERENPQPLTLKQLKKRINKPVYEKLEQKWYVIDDFDTIDELLSVITMTDSTEFDSENDIFEFYDYEPKEE